MLRDRFERLRGVLDRRQPDLTILLEDVHKPHNLSALLRTCDAVGVFRAHAVTTREFTTRAVESIAMGTGRWVELEHHHGLDEAFAALAAAGFTLWAADLGPGSIDFRAIDYTVPTAVLFGEEKKGLSAAARARVNGRLTIPMAGMAASLNVSVAAALVLFEAERQRRAAGLYDGPSRLPAELYRRTLFEWCHPFVSALCRRRGLDYPPLAADGSIVGTVPR